MPCCMKPPRARRSAPCCDRLTSVIALLCPPQPPPLRVIIDSAQQRKDGRSTPLKRSRANSHATRERLLSTGLPFTVEAFFHTVGMR